MKSSKLIFILTLMLMIISVGGVSAVDSVDITVSDAVSFDDGLDIQTVAVSDQSLGDNLITSGEGNATPKTWEVDDNNYDTYFDLNDDYYPGIIRADAPIKSGDTLKLGNLTSKILYIDRTLTITSMSEDSVMTNCMLQLVAGSDNSVVSGLHIYIDYAQIPDISTQLFCLAITDVDNITVKNNLFENGGKKTSGKGGSYAMAIANVTNSLFTKNTIYSFIVLDNGTKQGSDTAIQLTHSSNNIISYNDIEANGANCIYFIQNSISGIWTKPTDVSLVSVNNIIEYNTLNANAATNNAMAWVCQHYGGADNNTYRFNIICNGSMGITSSGGVGEICYNNTIYNVGTGIAAVNNFTVYNNIINATATGITAGGSAQIYNNIINVNAATGMGISVSGAMDGCLIKDNQIFVTANKSATGIKVTKQSVNGVISGNTIEVYDEANASVGINIGTTVDTAAGTMPNVVVSNNKITAQKMGIVLNKTVNCTVDGNIINLLNDDEAYGIYVACSKTNTTVAPNSTNNVISNNKINAKTGIKVGDDTSKKSIIGLEISNNEINAVDVGIDISKVESTVNDMITGIDVTISANDINVESSENAYGIYSKFGQVNVLIYENNIAVKGPFAYGVALSSANANIAKNMIKVSGNTSVGIYTNTKTNIVDNNIVA
ncbi:MAG: right-handed parallel beta-helix repeat-containing protein, partial [Methanobacteriaceae archaeon]|nr:right-handed parallel beta-helix repeat-containing protein [Methanobacteriaceae archaeon]